ncbi:MAG: glycosyltransferase [Nanoarchaeota archaeon]
MLSIIIPTWNEEKYLPKLLGCIKQQTYINYEIIVADADSTDKTRLIAKKYGCRIVKGGFPAAGRNKGAEIAKGEILAFFDADVQFGPDFLRNVTDELKHRKLDVAGCLINPMSNETAYRIFFVIYNFTIFLIQFFYPNAAGCSIFCKKSLYKKMNGFDETIKLGEDLDYVNRCSKHGKFRIIKSEKVSLSMRRFDHEGKFKVAFRHIASALYRIAFGQIRKDTFRYNLRYKK